MAPSDTSGELVAYQVDHLLSNPLDEATADRATFEEPSPRVPMRDSRASSIIGTSAKWLATAADALLAVTLICDVGVVIANLLCRTFAGFSLLWNEEISQLAITILAFVGGAVAYYRGQHPAMRVLVSRLLPTRWTPAHESYVDSVMVGFGLAVLWTGIPFLRSQWALPTPILHMSSGWSVVALDAGAVLTIAFGLARLAVRPWRIAAFWLGVVGGVTVIFIALQADLSALPPGVVLAISLATASVLFLTAVPVGYVLGIAALIYMYGSAVPLSTLPTTLELGVNNNTIILAVPFFILAGLVMSAGRITDRIMSFVSNLIGHTHGGLRHAVVISMMVFSGMSGSKVADCAAIAAGTRDSLDARGYSRSESAAVLGAAAACGDTIPPSLMMLVLGSITSVSISALFLAGILPAVVSAVALMSVVAVRAKRRGEALQPRASRAVIVRSGVHAFFPLLMPVFLVWGLISGFSTPTELSALAVLYGVLLTSIFFRSLSVKGMWLAMKDTNTLVGIVMLVLATASSFAWVLAIANVPAEVAKFLLAVPGGRAAVLIVISVALVLIGSLFEGLPALIVFAPLLLPVMGSLGVSTTQFSIVLIMAIGLGFHLPPLGFGFYISCSLYRTPIEPVVKPMLIYAAVLTVIIIGTVFVSPLTLWLPHLVGVR